MKIVFHTTVYSPEECETIYHNLLYYLNHEIDCGVQSCEDCGCNNLCDDVIWYISFDVQGLHDLATDPVIFDLDNYTDKALKLLLKAIRHLNYRVHCNANGGPCDLCRCKLLCDDAIAALDSIQIYMNDIRKGDHNDV